MGTAQNSTENNRKQRVKKVANSGLFIKHYQEGGVSEDILGNAEKSTEVVKSDTSFSSTSSGSSGSSSESSSDPEEPKESTNKELPVSSGKPGSDSKQEVQKETAAKSGGRKKSRSRKKVKRRTKSRALKLGLQV